MLYELSKDMNRFCVDYKARGVAEFASPFPFSMFSGRKTASKNDMQNMFRNSCSS